VTEIVGDWQIDLLEPLFENMRALAAVIAERSIVENADEVADEVESALTLFEKWQGFDGSGLSLSDYILRENAVWWDFWDYLGGHIRKWWD
jgi:hypothetical protein